MTAAERIRAARLESNLRAGWYLRHGTTRVPRDWFALEYGMATTTAARTLVAAIHPKELAILPDLYPNAFIS